MVDRAGRRPARFPPAKVAAAALRIEEAIANTDANPTDLALTQGAAGGDLLFGEACVRRGVPLRLLLPIAEPDFIEVSVTASSDGHEWKQRYVALRPRLQAPPHIMPKLPGIDSFEACNQWIIDTARSSGAEVLHLICLWDGESADGPGGTGHMVSEFQRAGGQVTWIDTRAL